MRLTRPVKSIGLYERRIECFYYLITVNNRHRDWFLEVQELAGLEEDELARQRI